MSQIRLADSAKLDLLDIWLFLSSSNMELADRVIDQITVTYERLADFPEMGRSRDELFPGYRSFPIDGYLIFYRPIQNGVEIIRVVHGSRNLPELF
jgi:toxin ParE1/3/4